LRENDISRFFSAHEPAEMGIIAGYKAVHTPSNISTGLKGRIIWFKLGGGKEDSRELYLFRNRESGRGVSKRQDIASRIRREPTDVPA